MQYIPLNFDILKSPYNWLVVGMMVLIGGLAMNLIFSNPPATSEDTQ